MNPDRRLGSSQPGCFPANGVPPELGSVGAGAAHASVRYQRGLAQWDRSKRRPSHGHGRTALGSVKLGPTVRAHGGAHRHNPKRESASARVVPTDWAADFYSGAGVHNTELAIENRFLNRAKDLASRERVWSSRGRWGVYMVIRSLLGFWARSGQRPVKRLLYCD